MKNVYRTKARDGIVSFLMKHPEQRFTAKEIFEAVNKLTEGINKTTIYRNLDRMCETGELLKFKEPNQDSWYYQYSSEHEHCDEHMHAQCSECGKIFHLEKPFASSFGKKVLSEYGIDIDPAQTVIIGKCNKCRNKAKK